MDESRETTMSEPGPTPPQKSHGRDRRVDNVVLCHMDYSLRDLTVHRRALSMGVNVELDLFGYPAWTRSYVFDMPSDTERVRTLIDLAADWVRGPDLLQHDVCMKIQMTSYGGYGYAHLLDAVSETFEQLTGSHDLLMQFGVENTRRVLCWTLRPAEMAGKG
jgi:phosphotriesterase-related protein